MSDGIKIEGGFNDSDLVFAEEFTGNSIQDVLGRFGNALQRDLVQSLDSKGKNATSTLQQSITFNVELFADSYEFSLSMAKYWQWVDEGRKPGKQPPIEPIKNWVKVKGVFGGLEAKDADGVAFAIARKIGQFGFPASNFYSDVINDGRLQKLEEDLAKAAADDITGLFFSL